MTAETELIINLSRIIQIIPGYDALQNIRRLSTFNSS